MPKFAVYYIPKLQDEFYCLGSSILGYDIRKRELITTADEIIKYLGSYNEEWVKLARPYGFHLTIGDAIDFDICNISQIEYETEFLIKCFNPKHTFKLKRHQHNFITFWNNGKILVLRYEPNDYLKIFHTLIASCIHPLGKNSSYLKRYILKTDQYITNTYRINRILKFYSPTIFDSYTPHFTLLNPYTGENHDKIKEAFLKIFGKFSKIELSSICLLIQMNDDENWYIYKEIEL